MVNFRYEKNTGQFRNLTTGKFAPLSDVTTALDSEVLTLQGKLGNLATQYTQGKMDLATFQSQMATEIKYAHIRASGVGAGGSDRLTKKHYGSIGGRLNNEFTQFLKGFGDAVAGDQLSEAQIIARAKMYARSLKQTFHASRHITRGQDGALEGKRSLDSGAKHCSACPDYDTGGQWVSISEIVPVGTACPCRGNCRCHVEYRNFRLSDRFV